MKAWNINGRTFVCTRGIGVELKDGKIINGDGGFDDFRDCINHLYGHSDGYDFLLPSELSDLLKSKTEEALSKETKDMINKVVKAFYEEAYGTFDQCLEELGYR